MPSFKRKLIAIAVALIAGTAAAQYNREQSSATPYTTYSNRSFSINGKPIWLFAGDVEYWRLPRELWRDRLMRVKRSGYNTVSFYVAWNLHEPVQGQFHFEDNLDLDAWLSLIHELGMYSLVRVGPYICAEVDFGGFPPWLVDLNLKIRGTDAKYLERVDAFYNKIFPIISKHQITKGGSVVSVQIENEHYPAGGEYQTHLVNTARAQGMVVPYIWSMVNNGTTYDPGAFPVFGTKGFMTEQWIGWIGRYGPPGAADMNTYTGQTWRMLGAGTGGTSHYMTIGGTNFGYTASADQRVTSYDYGSPIGELGQIRQGLYAVKQTGWLVDAFGSIFATSTNGSTEASGMPGTLASYVQTSSAGKAAMVSGGSASFQVNWKNKGVTVPTTGNWTLQAGYGAQFLADAPITSNLTLDYSATGILTRKQWGDRIYMVLYNTPGNTGGDIAFTYKTAPSTAPGAPWTWNATAKRASLRFNYPTTDSVMEVVLDEGAGKTLVLLVVNTNMSNKTWITDSSIVVGAEYVDENENIQFQAAGGRAFVYTAKGMEKVVKEATTAPSAKSFASGWSWISSPEVGATYDDASWKQSANPQTMTSYGWSNGYGWYRATYTAASAGTATLALPNVQGGVFVFVNGAYAGNKASQSITLKQGANTIAVLSNAPLRDKMYMTYNFSAPDKVRAGFWGGVTIGGNAVGPWRFRGGFEGVDESPMMGTISTTSWSNLLQKTWSTGAAPSDNVPRLWRMDFDYTPPENAVQTWTLKGTVTDGTQGVVWFNGHCLGRQLTNQPALFVPECWLKPKNTIIVMTHGGGAPQGYSLAPIEYRSLAKSSRTTSVTPKVVSAGRTSSARTAVVGLWGGLSMPSGFAQDASSLSLYDFQGHCLAKSIPVVNGVPALPASLALPRGMYIARTED